MCAHFYQRGPDIKTGAEKVFGFQKANHAKKPWIREKMIENTE